MSGKVRKLKPGVECPQPSAKELSDREADLRATVKRYMPAFVGAVTDVAGKVENPIVAVNQDAFAANYDADEYTLLGMAVKFAGLYGVSVMFMGKNRETL